MAAENQSKSASSSTTTNTNTNKSNKRKQRYLPNNKPVKKKGAYPLRPGVQGFFITCDGGRERQASNEAINVIDSFYEELVHGKDTGMMPAGLPSNPLNKKITFSYSDDDDDEDEEEEEEEKDEEKKEEKKDEEKKEEEKNEEKKEEKKDEEKKEEEKDEEKKEEEKNEEKKEEANKSDQTEEKTDDGKEDGKNNENQANKAEDGKNNENQAHKADEPPAKKQCIETHASKCVINDKVEEKSIDKLIEAELNELGDKNKRRFINLDSGCNGVVFVQMRKRDGDPGPKDIAQHMMTSAASTRKHMSRFILRVLPVEVACYASEEEISRAIKPLVEQYFPETQNPQKFAVLYEARANTGIDRMKIINSVAKSVPGPHKVDLSNPDKTIVVEIVKTVCLIGVVEKYKELAKFNLRQLTSPK